MDGRDTTDVRSGTAGTEEGQGEVWCGAREDDSDLDRVGGITDSDISACEGISKIAERLRSQYVRIYVKLGATSSSKGYAADFYRDALLLRTRMEMLVRPHNEAILSLRRTLAITRRA